MFGFGHVSSVVSGGILRGFAWIAIALFAVPVFAQVENVVNDGVPDGGVQISPIRFEAQLRPGETWYGTLNLKNFSQDDHELTVSAENFVVTDDTENITFFPSGDATHMQAPDIADWIYLPQKTVFLSGDGTATVPFEIRVPEDAPTGGYYGALFVTLSAPGGYDAATGQARIGINSRIGALLIFSVHGTEPARIEGSLERFSLLKKVYFTAPLEIRTAISNTGNIHFRGGGSVVIARGGKTVATLPLPSQINYPHKVRTYITRWHFGLLAFGPYTATVRYDSLSGLVHLEKTETVWIFSWVIIAIIVGTLFVAIAVWHYIKTHFVIQRRK